MNQEIPQSYIEGLTEFLLRLEQFIQEPIDQHTLLYGIDGKFYAPTIKLIIILKLVYMGYFNWRLFRRYAFIISAASGLYVGKYLSDI